MSGPGARVQVSGDPAESKGGRAGDSSGANGGSPGRGTAERERDEGWRHGRCAHPVGGGERNGCGETQKDGTGSSEGREPSGEREGVETRASQRRGQVGRVPLPNSCSSLSSALRRASPSLTSSFSPFRVLGFLWEFEPRFVLFSSFFCDCGSGKLLGTVKGQASGASVKRCCVRFLGMCYSDFLSPYCLFNSQFLVLRSMVWFLMEMWHTLQPVVSHEIYSDWL